MLEPEQVKEKLGGAVAFPVTPFRQDLSLDREALRQNLGEMLEFPFCAVVAAGGTGEMYSLSLAEYQTVIETTVEAAAGRIPVIAGVGFGHEIALEMAGIAHAAGADGLLCFPPYYPNAHSEGLFHYYKAIGDAVPCAIFIYTRDWVNFTPMEAHKLTEAMPNLVGWKDGQGDLRRYQMIMERVGSRLHWIGGIGDDMVPGYYSIGIRTYTSSISNIAPRLSLQLHERASILDMAALQRLMSNYVLPLYAMRSRRKGYEVSMMKAAMEILGKPAGPVRPPLVWPRSEEVHNLERLMERYQPVL